MHLREGRPERSPPHPLGKEIPPQGMRNSPRFRCWCQNDPVCFGVGGSTVAVSAAQAALLVFYSPPPCFSGIKGPILQNDERLLCSVGNYHLLFWELRALRISGLGPDYLCNCCSDIFMPSRVSVCSAEGLYFIFVTLGFLQRQGILVVI